MIPNKHQAKTADAISNDFLNWRRSRYDLGMGEEWRPVIGYEGRYEVSNLGRVRSLDRKVPHRYGLRRVEGRILKPYSRPPRGYPTVNFGHRGPKHSVHTLVLEAFVGPCPPGQECLHENDDPTDNTLSNLRWGTRSENLRDRVKNGTHNHANKTHCLRDHEFTAENTYIKKDGGRQCKECLRIGELRRAAS